MTKYEKEVIKENLQHFIKNFGNIRIESDGDKGFNVYLPPNSDWPIHYCHNIHYLDGWLYGCVQSANRREFHENGEWFGHIRWSEEDLEIALSDKSLPTTEENISKLRNRLSHHSFTDHMIAAGWDYIESLIDDMENEDEKSNLHGR